MADETQTTAAPDPSEAEAETTKQREREARKQARAVVREEERAGESNPEEFPRERFLSDESYAFLGQPPFVVAGALDAAGISKKNLTIDEAREAVRDYLAREV